MPPKDLTIDKGENTIMDSKRLPEGFLELIDGWIFMPDDPDQLHKIPGRSEAATLPAGVTNDNAKGIVHLQFDNSANVVVLLGNDKLYEATAGDTLGAWAVVQDSAGTDFGVTGDFLKAVADGANRWILWSGAEDERALIRDEDGNWRLLGMLQPGQPSLTTTPVTGGPAPTINQPDTEELAPPGVYEIGVTDQRFSDEALAYDDGADDKYETFAGHTTNMRHDGKGDRDITGTRWGFSAAAAAGFADSTAQGYQCIISIDLSKGTQGDPQPLPLGEGRELGFTGQFSLELYDTFQSTTVPIHQIKFSESYISSHRSDLNNGLQVIFETDQLPAASELEWENLKLDIKWHYTRGTTQVTSMVRDIRWAKDGVLVVAQVDAGTYEYAITEVHQIALASGETFVTESEPSGRLAVTVTGTSADSIDLTLPTALANLPSAGFASADMSFNIYRSTSTGFYPDLGLIANVGVNSVVYRDVFKVPFSTLGVPSIRVVSVGGAFAAQAGLPPAIFDATLFRGSLVMIPTSVRRALKWTLANQPDALPFFHDLRTLPSERNDALVGVTELNDMLLVFLRTRVLRVRLLPNSTKGASFDLDSLEVDSLSPDEGLAGGPRTYTVFKTEHGRGLAAWCSDNGVWMTDGSLAQENGLGVRKLSTNMNWRNLVDVSSLADANMGYDSNLQIVYLDCDDQNGDRVTFLFHTSPKHWVGQGESTVPKMTRTSALVALDRTFGEDAAVIKHWSLYTQGTTPKVLLERSGTDNDGSDIDSYAASGWKYLAGARSSFHLFEGLLAHQDWGSRGILDVEVTTRRDETGITQNRRRDVPLRGNAAHSWLIERAGQSMMFSFRHKGKTISTGDPPYAIGPFAVEFEPQGEIQDE
jgi:hypothetical protein